MRAGSSSIPTSSTWWPSSTRSTGCASSAARCTWSGRSCWGGTSSGPSGAGSRSRRRPRLSSRAEERGTMSQEKETFHRFLEGKSLWFAVLTTVTIAIGGLVEIVPMFTATLGPESLPGVKPYTALEIAGRDLYIREGCYVCHSQMVRPMRAEILRYGEWTRAGEYAYDHPFLLGSR